MPKATGAVPADIVSRAALAKTTDDWQKLAADLAPVMTAILNGEAKATAAQAALIKDVMNRAFGKPVAAQQEKRVNAGLLILPSFGRMDKMSFTCPKCGYDALNETIRTKKDSESNEASNG